MMMIDRDKLHIKLLDMEFSIQDQDPILDAMDACTIDAAPVVHGRWIKPDGVVTPWCSNCKRPATRTFFGAYDYSEFCPRCGAKMDLPDGE